jgi:acyl-coenzyme A thioesterase PaaI-like protein
MSLAPPRTTILTVEFKVNLLAPALGERFVARGHVIRSGRTITICGGDVVALNVTEEKLIATMLATMMTIKEG